MKHRQPCNSCQSQEVQQTQWFQPPAEPIVCPPQYRVHDTFIPQLQPVIHPIVNINRQNVFPVRQNFYPEINRTEVVNPASSQVSPYANQFQQGAYQQQSLQQSHHQQGFPSCKPRY